MRDNVAVDPHDRVSGRDHRALGRKTKRLYFHDMLARRGGWFRDSLPGYEQHRNQSNHVHILDSLHDVLIHGFRVIFMHLKGLRGCGEQSLEFRVLSFTTHSPICLSEYIFQSSTCYFFWSTGYPSV